jgi:REP element-mobilizing transposase RayT
VPYWQLYYHFIWSTKDRQPLITPEIEGRLYAVIASKVNEYDAVVFAIGGMEEHVHLVVAIPPKVSLSTFIGQVKGASSHFVNHELDLPHYFRWQSEYGVITFAKRSLPDVVRYVNNQREIHGKRQLIADFERVEP